MTTINMLTKEFGTNKVLAPPSVLTLPVNYTAVQIIGVQDAQNQIQNYRFCLWTLGSNFQIDPQIQINAAAADITATAWYYAIGGGISKKTYAVGWAFSVDTGEFLVHEVPFDAVNPPDGWTSTDSAVETTNHDVDITAKAMIQNQFFEEWYSLNPAATTVSGQLIKVKIGNSAWIIAKYKTVSRLPLGIVEPSAMTIPGEDSIGKQMMKWLWTAKIPQMIKEFGLQPMSAEDRRTYSTQTPTQFRCAIGAPHLHYRGNTYLLKPKQWKTFAANVQKELSKKLTGAKSVNFDKLIEISKAVEELS